MSGGSHIPMFPVLPNVECPVACLAVQGILNGQGQHYRQTGFSSAIKEFREFVQCTTKLLRPYSMELRYNSVNT